MVVAGKPNKLGRYEILAALSSGAVADIFLGQKVGGTISRQVVIKRIHPHLADQPKFLQLFLEEARLASLVHHSNVVQILEVGEEDGEYFMAMEHVDGFNLEALTVGIQKGERDRLPYWIAGEIIAQACDGLHMAHELRRGDGKPLGLVHRDVSPGNLMLSAQGEVKLLDFGIAKALDSAVQTRTGEVKGNFPYVSPECAWGETLDRRSDIFSLGALLAELLVGRVFFQGDNDLAVLKAVTELPVPSLREIDPAIPQELADIVSRCLNRDKARRYADAAELSGALRAALGELGQECSPEVLAGYLGSHCKDLIHKSRQSLVETIRAAVGTQPAKSSTPPAPKDKKKRSAVIPLLIVLELILAITIGAAYFNGWFPFD